MRKIIFLLVVMVLLSSVALAVEDEIQLKDGVLGDPDYSVNLEGRSFWEKLKGIFQPQGFTVIGGASCSVYPDVGADYTPSSGNTNGKLCRENTNHIGEAAQLFEITDSGWKYLGEMQILKGDRKCFDVEQGKNYHWDVYYCDETVKRSCTDSDGGKDYYERGTVTFKVGDSTTTVADKCISSTKVQEIFCDADNSVSSVTKSCSCSDGSCNEQLQTDINLGNIEVSNNGDLTLNQKYSITGTAEIGGTCDGCVIETGQGYYGQAFSIIESDKGACGDDISVGVKFDADNKQTIRWKLDDVATQQGSFKVEIAAYDGCANEGKGRKLDSKTINVNVVEVTDIEEDQTQNDDTSDDVTCYFCRASELFSSTYDAECPEGTSIIELECALETEDSKCPNEVDAEACVVDIYDPNMESPVVVIPNQPVITGGIIFDLEKKPLQSGLIILLGVVLVTIMVMLGIRARQKKKRKR